MNRAQWRVLYRQFLFRVFDPEILSPQAQGDTNSLLGQFAALLIFVSSILAFGAILLSDGAAPGIDPRDSQLVFLMIAQHFLIATTMLVVGLFAVLSWDATFPDQRDLMVLAPLPVRARTMFVAKVAAVATSLGLTIVLLQSPLGLILPLVFAAHATPAALPALTFDATPVPVAARDLQAVMDRDLKQALTTGDLAPGTGTGLAIGVWQRGERRVFMSGGEKPGSPSILSRADDMLTSLEATRKELALSSVYDADTGFTSSAFFNPQMDTAVVVLMNRRPSMLFSTGSVAEHIRQRLSGEPAISLDTVLVPASRGFRGVLRSFGAYWFTMLAAGLFVYGGILVAQGLAALALPRRLFLRLSGYLQLAAIGLILGVYFLQPGFVGLNGLTIGSVGRVIQWLPSYCFLALYQQLNGSMHPVLAPLAWRAWMGLAGVVCLMPMVYALSYWRTLRQIVESPDIVPGSRRSGWLPQFGNPSQTAIGQFIVRTLTRSRQHRLILGFYLGIGLAFACLRLKGSAGSTDTRIGESQQLWVASILMMVLAVLGTRVAFALPLDLRANWIYRVIGVRGGLQTLAASRRALLLLSVAPVWLLTAMACLSIWPGRQNAGHLAVLGLLGLILTDLCLLRFQKIPFTCSYLPGKSRFNMAFLAALVLLSVGSDAVAIERNALQETGSMTLMLTLLAVVWVCVRWKTVALAKREEQELRFEEEAPPTVMGLSLYRDGVMSLNGRH